MKVILRNQWRSLFELLTHSLCVHEEIGMDSKTDRCLYMRYCMVSVKRLLYQRDHNWITQIVRHC